MVVTVEELQRLEDTDIRELKRENLDNAGDVTFDKTKPANLRMLEFLEKNRNPYVSRYERTPKNGWFDIIVFSKAMLRQSVCCQGEADFLR